MCIPNWAYKGTKYMWEGISVNLRHPLATGYQTEKFGTVISESEAVPSKRCEKRLNSIFL